MGGTSTKGTRTEQVIFPFTVGNVVTRRMSTVSYTHLDVYKRQRLRLIIPLFRDVGEEEYAAVSRMVAKEIGIDLFDDTT